MQNIVLLLSLSTQDLPLLGGQKQNNPRPNNLHRLPQSIQEFHPSIV